jgi:hypothetical protein
MPKTKPTKKIVSTQDLIIAVLSSSTQSLEVVQKLKPSKNVVRKAMVVLRDQPEVCQALEQYAQSQGYTAFAKRGKFAPTVGETRVYNVQQINSDPSFIRLPLSSLSLKKGAKVRVDFEDGEIVVRPAFSA